jgi:hypothetical protein
MAFVLLIKTKTEKLAINRKGRMTEYFTIKVFGKDCFNKSWTLPKKKNTSNKKKE